MVGTVTPGLADTLSAAWQAIRRQHSAVPNAAVHVLDDWPEPCGAAAWRASAGGDAMPDVVVSAAQLREGPEAVFAVLLHEAAHGVALTTTKVKDVAADGRMHTVRYAVVAGQLGLEAEQVGDRGHAATTMTATARTAYAGVIQRLAGELAQAPAPADAGNQERIAPMTQDQRDLQLTDDGTWEPFDAFESGAGEDVTTALERQGWSSFLDIGSGEQIGMSIEVWTRRRDDGSAEYLLGVWGEQLGSPYLKVAGLPKVMELLAAWAPIVQAASIARLASDLGEGLINPEGLVETIAARAAWGVQEGLPNLEKQKRAADQARRRRASQPPPPRPV